MDELVALIKSMNERIKVLENSILLADVVIPTGGRLVVDSLASDPTPQNGRIYYNTTTNKYKVCENGLWRTITTT